MKGREVENKRKSIRFFSQLKARYFINDGEKDRKECTIINVSREGMGLTFLTREKIDIGSTIHLETFASTEIEPINIEGVLRWLELLMGNNFIGGIELTESLDESKLSGLSSVYAGKDKTD